MPQILISNTAHRAISTFSRGNVTVLARRTINGWLVPLSTDALHAIEDRRLPGESLSETLTRVMTYAANRVPHEV